MRNLIEVHDRYVKKIFGVPSAEVEGDMKQTKDSFNRELLAYKKFAEHRVDFIPELLEYDDKDLVLVIQKVSGINLVELLNQNDKDLSSNFNINLIIDKIIAIDTFLYNNKINALQISPKDLIYDFQQNKMFLIDFEFTIVNSSYKQILYDRLFQNDKLLETTNNNLRNLFFDSLRIRKKEFKLFYYRKLKNSVIKHTRSLLPLQTKKEYKHTKIKVSY